jgi:hypothetical protein
VAGARHRLGDVGALLEAALAKVGVA